VTLDTWVGGRSGLIYRWAYADDQVTLHRHSTEIIFSASRFERRNICPGTPKFRIDDIPGSLDDNGKLVLRRLIWEGLVQILP
jgi:hypothetical protein